MARRYRVLQPVSWAEAGTEVEVSGRMVNGVNLYYADAVAINIAALVEGGFLEEITPKVPCPACTADKSVKKADVPHFQKQETLAEHYESEHKALATPDFEEVV